MADLDYFDSSQESRLVLATAVAQCAIEH